ncbi:MAG TPA: DUF4097 family beta strand repeat-containing protein [Acidimicrobiia bacterium]
MIHQTFQIKHQPEIDVRIHAGRVEVLEGSAGVIEVTVDTNDPNFKVQQRGDIVEIASDREARWLFSRPAEVTVRMPPGGRAQIRTASADVIIQVPIDRIDVDSASGEIRVGTVRKAEIKTASGNIRAEEVTEMIRAKSASGDIRVARAHGDADISTASGDVRIDDSDAVVDVSTASGRVQVDRFVGSVINLKSMSGSFEVGMESGTKVELDAASLSGRVNWPPKLEVQPEIKRQVTMKAKSMSGDLTLKRIT